MIRAIYSGISGLRNHQTRIDVIGNNISNVNTVGFKAGRVNFQDQVSQLVVAATAPGGQGNGRGGVNPKQIGLGMTVATVDTVHTQGNIQTTNKVTDLAIQGDGFFILSDGVNRFYTRAGSYDFDREGKMVAPGNGLHVQGWEAERSFDAAGEPVFSINRSSPVKDLSIPAGATIAPRKTTEIVLRGNLDANTNTYPPTNPAQPLVPPAPPPGAPANFFESSSEVFDSLGNVHNVTVRFSRLQANPGAGIQPNTWVWEIASPNAAVTQGNAGDPPQPLVFDNRGLLSGTLTNPPTRYNGGSWDITWTLPDGSTTSTTIRPNFGNQQEAAFLTQFASPPSAVIADQNGFTNGLLTGVTIDKSGIMNGIFSNGRQRLLGQVSLATFTNPGGLIKEGENLYIKTNNSGDAVIRAANEGEAGSITAGALEMSNVDLAQEFSEMIVTQRGFQGSARVITTSDEILQELINLKR